MKKKPTNCYFKGKKCVLPVMLVLYWFIKILVTQWHSDILCGGSAKSFRLEFGCLSVTNSYKHEILNQSCTGWVILSELQSVWLIIGSDYIYNKSQWNICNTPNCAKLVNAASE